MIANHQPEQALAAFVAGLTYDDLPEAARESARRSILDTIGVTMAASTQGLGHRQLFRMVAAARGRRESTVLGFGRRVPAAMAALANGAMARAVDFDDGHDPSSTHPSSVVVPATLALAEAQRQTVTGRDLITAVAAGNEVLCRLGMAVAAGPAGLALDSWFPTSVFGAFGGTAACARIAGLDAAGVRSALGIALFQASGTLEAFSATGQKSMMRGMITGFTAQGAVQAALMARSGIEGVPDWLDGEYGLFRVYFRGQYSREALLDGLGSRFVMAEIGLKPWPTCRFIHAYIDATLQLVTEHDLDPSDIVEIRPHVAGFVESRCAPIDDQRRPENFNHAGHALPYLLAAAAVRRRVSIDDLIGGLADRAVLSLAERVTPVHDDRFSAENRIGVALVEIACRDGTRYQRQLDVAYGDPRRPIGWPELERKFLDCAAFSRCPVGADTARRVLDRISALEEVDDVAMIVDPLVAGMALRSRGRERAHG